MVAMLAFGGTYAFFTAQAENIVGSVKTGKVELKAGGSFTADIANLLPGDKITSAEGITLTTENSTVDTFVAIEVTISGPAVVGFDVASLLTDATGVTGATWVQNGETNVYVLAESANKAAAVTAGESVVIIEGDKVWEQEDVNYNGNGGTLMGKEFTITIRSASIQAKNFHNGAPTVAQVVAGVTFYTAPQGT